MKINLILFFLFIFNSTLYSEDKIPLTQHSSISGIIEENYPARDITEKFQIIKVEDIPNILINVGKYKSVNCELDNISKIYLCTNEGKPILVKFDGFQFYAITKDTNDFVITPSISHVESDGKTIFEVSPMFLVVENNASLDDKNNFLNITNFFRYYNSSGEKEINNGSKAYLKIYESFMEDKNKIVNNFIQSNYLVELEDGQKINCARGSKKSISVMNKNQNLTDWNKLQCGSFQCDPVKYNDKEYKVTMLYDTDSESKSMGANSIHLIDQNGIGPSVNIKKISSSVSSTPLLDDSYRLEASSKFKNAESFPNFTSMLIDDEEINHFTTILDSNLKQEKDKILDQKSLDLKTFIDNLEMSCSDDDKALKTLKEGRTKLFTKLAEQEVVELIQVLDGGRLISDFIDPMMAPKYGCFYQGVYLNDEAVKNLDRLKKNIYPDRQVEQTISLDRATELFNKAISMQDIPWNYKQDGCYARAHLMARRFEAEGVRVDKVWLNGDLYVPGSEPPLEWEYHVAPIVYVKDDKGIVKKMVIDPALFSKPVTVEEWDQKISKKTLRGSTLTAFPFPRNTNLLERSSIAFSSSDPYQPGESINMTEQEKMDLANQTMKNNKSVEIK